MIKTQENDISRLKYVISEAEAEKAKQKKDYEMVVDVFSDIERVIVYSALMLEMGLVEVLVLVYSKNIIEEMMVCETQYSA